jgi:hypothetical protein
MSYLLRLTSFSLFAVVALAGCGADYPSDEEIGTIASTTSALSSDLANRFVAEHNRYRAQHGASALGWSSQLAATAQSWANRCSKSHSGTRGAGENWATGWGGYNGTPELVVAGWYNEVSNYNFSNPGYSSSTGHFTQIVWKSTTALGCGYAKCGQEDYWVCQYSPQGNISGQFPQNVSPKSRIFDVVSRPCRIDRQCPPGKRCVKRVDRPMGFCM